MPVVLLGVQRNSDPLGGRTVRTAPKLPAILPVVIAPVAASLSMARLFDVRTEPPSAAARARVAVRTLESLLFGEKHAKSECILHT